MIAYLDSSVLLRWLLREPDPLADVTKYEAVYSSVVLRIECKRVLHRLFLQEPLSNDMYIELSEELNNLIAGIRLVEFAKQIQKRAEEPFVFPIGSLDAIHLASIVAVRDSAPVTLLTHDAQLAKNAKALDVPVVGVP